MFMLGFVLTTGLVLSILGSAVGFYGFTKVADWVLPGNEEKLMAAMKKLNLKKSSAEAQFLKELTLAETTKMAAEFKKSMANDSVGTNNMLQSIMSQPTSFRDTIGQKEGSDTATGLRGSRQDTESMQAAVSSLQQKTQRIDQEPATLRLTGPSRNAPKR